MRTVKCVLLLLCYFELTKGRPLTSDSAAKILKYKNDNDGLGSYKFEYETDNGITHSEQGALKEGTILTEGKYKYTGPNGVIISVVYTADQNGYRPKVTIGLGPTIVGVMRASPDLIASLVG